MRLKIKIEAISKTGSSEMGMQSRIRVRIRGCIKTWARASALANAQLNLCSAKADADKKVDFI